MRTPKNETAEMYASIMTEIKVRIEAINQGTNSRLPLPAPLVKEFCHLQIRMICELVALGCLVAHGDIEATKSNKCQGEYSAQRIMDSLEKLHPDFFPRSYRQKPHRGGRVVEFDHPEAPAMTKDEFLRLYNDCGEILHRGNLKKLLTQRSPIQVHYPDITAKAQRLVDLLKLHVVTRLGGKDLFVCVLQTPQEPDVQVFTAEVRQVEADVLAEFQQLGGGE